ncbi:MAG TPA: ABC transporter permease [Chitinophagaceae bacterium]|jgi:putative ABC transport system permease protein|nr:ABC transporter permease [Chitinophagaceae bacterium]
MIKNYLLIALKNFRKQKLFSLINILGLTIGITCCLMIFLFILNEFSYDNFHKHGKDIYRVMRVGDLNGDRLEIPYVALPYGPALANDFPDAIQKTVRVMQDNDLVSYEHISFNEKKILLADSNFFQFFDFRLVQGDPGSVLSNPNSIVLTKAAAKKYFGDADPMGKVLEFNKKQQLKVTGIAADVPANSHLQFDMVAPLELLRSVQPKWFEQWPNNTLFTYVQLNPAVNPEQLKKSFPGFMDKYLGDFYAQIGHKMGLTLQPLHSIYFASDGFDSAKHGNKKMVYIFMSIAVLVLTIACINFVNLATARASDRSKEVGLRKVLGAVKKQLLGQFILESVLFAFVASLLSLGLLQLLMPVYTHFLGYDLPPVWSNPFLYVFLIGVIIVVGLLAGSYPALVLASFSPIESLKGKLKVGKSGAFFRKTLVVFQFGISVLLIISVVVIFSQMNYVKHADLGFNKEQTLIVRFDNAAIASRQEQFKNELMTIPAVKNVSMMSGEPGGFHDTYSFEAEANPSEKYLFNTEYTDLDFVKTLGLTIIAGRNFSKSFGTDSLQAVLINRNAASKLGYTPEQAIGKWIKNISSDSVRRTIVGVVEDYHYVSLKDPIGPLVIAPGDDRRLALIKMQTDKLSDALADIKKAYIHAAPDYPFEYNFLDERFDQLYRTESRQESVLSIFSIIAIFVACLGLFGLASYTAIKRTKEIGVRKVLGSSVQNIVLLLSGDLLKPVLIGTLLAIPLGYYVMNQWLEGFAYRIHFHWWMFVIAAAIAIIIALLTVGVQAVKAALANPVKSLRTE